MFDLSSTLMDVHIQLDGKDNAYVRLTKEQLEKISDVRCLLFKVIEYGEASLPDDEEEKILGIEDEGAIILGNGADTAADWKHGTFRNNFRLKYPMLNGHHVFLNMIANNDNSTIYAVPIKLNGKECYMEVAYLKDSQSYEIIDVRRGVDSNGGVVSRDSIEIRKGDTIQALFIGIVPGKTEDSLVMRVVEGAPFTVDDKLMIANTALGDGEYGYTFQFVNPLGQSRYANESVYLEVWNGKLENISVEHQVTADDLTINVSDDEVTISGVPTDSEDD